MLKQTGYSREAPLLPAILRFSIPLMLTGILQLAYNTADSIIVGRYAGHASLAAVGSTTSIIFLIITLFNGVSIGANYMAARDFGAQDDRGLFRAVHCAALLSVILGLLACVCGLLLSTPLLRWADAPEDVLPLSVLYLRIYFLGVPALVVYNFGSALLRAVGDTFYPLLFMIVSGALNVALNLLLVVVIPLDVAGVAIATSVSQLLSAVLVTVRLCTFRGPCRLELRKIRLYPDRTGQMLRLGFSAGLQGVLFSASNVMIQSAINSFGSVVMAGSSAASGIENFIHTALNTFYQSAITFTGQSIGASDPRRAVRVFRINLALTTGWALFYAHWPDLSGAPAGTVRPVHRSGLRRGHRRRCGPGAGPQPVPVGRRLDGNGLRHPPGLGHSMNPTVTTLIGACLLRVVWRYTVFEAVGTVESMYWSYPVSWLLTS